MKSLIPIYRSRTLSKKITVKVIACAIVLICFSETDHAHCSPLTRSDHLDPVNLLESKPYRSKIESVLFLTPANCARMTVSGGSAPEFVVSVYSRGKGAKYYVTATKASDSIWFSMAENSRSRTQKSVRVSRCDAELPASTALAIRRVWRQTLLQTRPHDDSLIDAPTGGDIVEFSVVAPGRTSLFGELPIYPGKNTLALQRLGMSLAGYCKASPSRRSLLAKKIEDEAKKLLSEKPSKLRIR